MMALNLPCVLGERERPTSLGGGTVLPRARRDELNGSGAREQTQRSPIDRLPHTRAMDPKEGDYVRFKHKRVETTGTVIKRSGTHVRVQPKDGGATLWKELSELLTLASHVDEVSEALGPVRSIACDDGDDTNLDDIDDVDDAVAVAAQSAQAAVEAEAEAEANAEAAEERLTGMVRVRGGGCAASKPRARSRWPCVSCVTSRMCPSLVSARATSRELRYCVPAPRRVQVQVTS